MKVNKQLLGLAMARKGVNYRQLAEKSGVSRATLSYLNNGKKCRPNVVAKLAHALGVDPAELIEKEA